MTCSCIRRSHRCLVPWIVCILPSLSLVGSLAHAGMVEPAFAQTAIAANLTALHHSQPSLQQFGQKRLVDSTLTTSATNQRRYRPKEVSRPDGTTVGAPRRYHPKEVSRPDGTTVGAPRRGDDFCGTEAIGAFTALAPLSHVGQTATSRPTFAWFIPDRQSAPVLFKLYAVAARSPIFATEVPAQAGIVSFTLPPQQPELKPGRYRWEIERICFPKRLEATVEFEVVKPSVNLEEHWYDALAEGLKSSQATGDRETILSLLEDLQEIETAAATQIPNTLNTPNSWKALLTKQSQHLKQIVEIEQRR